jgi:hypothetical protein
MVMKNHTFYYVIKERVNPLQEVKNQIKTHGDSHFLIQKIFSKHNNEYKLLLLDSYHNKYWSNEDVYITNFAGTPEFPAKLLKEVILPPSTNLQYKITNIYNEPLEVELVFQGMKLYDRKEMPTQRYRQYVVNIKIPANSRISQIVEIDIAKPFIIQKLLGYKKDPELTLTLNKFDISSLGGRRLFDDTIDFDNVFGRALRPNIIPELKVDPQSVLTFGIVNDNNVNTECQIVLDGYE